MRFDGGGGSFPGQEWTTESDALTSSTSISLLRRLREPEAHEAWKRFVALYTPLLFHWARNAGAQPPDDADLVQDILTHLVQKLPQFEYDQQQSFRAWLKTVALNRWRDEQRRWQPPRADATDSQLATLADPGSDAFELREHRGYLVRRALELMQSEFQPSTWKACWETTVSGRRAADVAAELGLTENAVYVAKGRVLRRLRQELAGLLD
jgi:RNA polymerase sigma-70 factor (ECF subfamily)